MQVQWNQNGNWLLSASRDQQLVVSYVAQRLMSRSQCRPTGYCPAARLQDSRTQERALLTALKKLLLPGWLAIQTGLWGLASLLAECFPVKHFKPAMGFFHKLQIQPKGAWHRQGVCTGVTYG